MSHPLLRVLCLYAIGVLLGLLTDFWPTWGLALVIGLPVACILSAKLRPFAWAVLMVSAGWLNFTLHTRIWSDNDLRRVAPDEPVLAEVRGRLVETPRVTSQMRNDEVQFRTLGELKVTEIRINNEPWRQAAGRLAVTSSDTLSTAFHQGQSVEISGVLDRPEGPRAEGLFNYAAYLEGRGIYFLLRAGGTNDWSLGADASTALPFTDRFVQWARRTLSRGLPEDDPATGLLQAMTLGWKTSLTNEIEEPFVKSGTMHIFAISGLHIALIAGIVLAILRLLRVPRGVCGALLIPLLWFYTAATGWQASAVRATVMMTIILGGWSLMRPSNLLNSLATAALLILLFDPRQLFQASFQLSFAVVLSLSLLLPPIQERLLRFLEPDPLLPAMLVPKWKRWAGAPLRWLLLMAATSLAAWLGSMPLAALYFHLFCPGTLLANVLVVPCASAALASTLASLATGAWWPWLSEVFNHGAWFWMHCMMNLSRGVSELPGAYHYVAPPSSALLAVYYGTLMVLAFGWVEPPRVKWFLSGSSLILASLLALQSYQHRVSATVTALPLNGGLTVHLKMPNSTAPILVDCGNTNTFESMLEPFMHAHGENGINALVLTHGDLRHMGAAALACERFKPQRIGISRVRFRSSAYRAWVDEMQADGLPISFLKSGEQFEEWSVLYPPSELKVSRADEGVLVLRGNMLGTRVLLLSDLDRTGQRKLLDQTPPDELRAEIVITGLPGEGEPLINDLLRAIQPSLIIVADDEWPAQRRASEELLARLRDGDATVLSTRRSGALKVEFGSEVWRVLKPSGEIMAASSPSRSGRKVEKD